VIARIIAFSVEKRWLVMLLTAIAAIIGGLSLARLPIDAVPDITNNQVQGYCQTNQILVSFAFD
jgi:cobalt-zinc-cadmium resistance protein CzcA